MTEITQDYLKFRLSYDPDTGVFTWLVGQDQGKKAGTTQSGGYLKIRINKKGYYSHRLAWLYVHGRTPAAQIDHINGERKDNRIVNLRECSDSQNKWNTGKMRTNKSGFKGVIWNKQAQKWMPRIMINGNVKYLGLFETAELAGAAYQAKACEVHGEFYRRNM